jgi:phosphohistidine phosphatase
MTGGTARRLILLRHAKSAWPDVSDQERPLAPRGRRDAPAAGRWLRKTGRVPDHVLCSTARRARETWELAGEKLHAHPRVTFEQRVYGASSAELLDLAGEELPATRTLLIVGHDPAMQALTLELGGTEPGGGSAGMLERVRVKFPTASIAVLEFSGDWPQLRPGQARLTDFVTPGDVRAGAADRD